MGVELGKVLAKKILAQLDKPDDVKDHDSSVCYFILSRFISVLMQLPAKTTGLIHWYQAHRKEQ